MKQIVLAFLCLTCSLVTVGQIRYEKGYFIDLNGKKTECQIRDNDWAANPIKIKYKLPGSEEIREGDALSIKEFWIETAFGRVQYIGATVKVDVLRDVDGGAEPRWETRNLFLKTLREGKASLYSFEGSGLPIYFYKVDSAAPKQLFYKQYRSMGESRLLYNNAFRGQLWADVKCPSTDFDDLQHLNYKRKALEAYVDAYNDCQGIVRSEPTGKRREMLHIYIQGGLTYTNLHSWADYKPYEHTIKGASGYKFGIALEMVLPFNKGKWGILVEPGYDHITGSAGNDKPGGLIYYDRVEIFRNMIEIPIGIRYYFSKKKTFSYYVNAYYTLAFKTSESAVEYYRFNYVLLRENFSIFNGLMIGPGMNYRRFGADLRYVFSTASQGTKFSGLALTAKIRLF